MPNRSGIGGCFEPINSCIKVINRCNKVTVHIQWIESAHLDVQFGKKKPKKNVDYT